MSGKTDTAAIVAFSIRLYAVALRCFPARFRAQCEEPIGVIVDDYLGDIYERRGLSGLIAAWRNLARDLVASAFEEWWSAFSAWLFYDPRRISVPLICAACGLIVVSNFQFGSDFSGTVDWATAIACIAFALGLTLRSVSAALIVLLVLTDTAAGAASVLVTRHNLHPVFDLTLKWVPLAFAMIATASYVGAFARRYC
ncbi:MAG: hypothetical protein ABI282_05585 [Candidatus Baltobacteraceae bacterium]